MTVQAEKKETSRPASQQFATVSIPDLRVQQISSVQGSSAAVVDPLQPPSRPSSKLHDIREAIEKTAAQNGNASTPESIGSGEANQRNANRFLSNIRSYDQEIQPIVDSIFEHYPEGGSSIVMFVGSENNPLLDITVARTAVNVQRKAEKRILIIDSDFDHGSLTYKLECVGNQGLADVANGSTDWQQTIRPTSLDSIDFVPVGREKLRRAEQLTSKLKMSLHKTASEYDFVFVCGGEAHSEAALAWGNHTNGTYLLVSMANSNKTIAQSAVSELRTHGARLLGCIVSEAE